MDRNFLRPFEDDPFFSGMPSTMMPSMALPGEGRRRSGGDNKRSRAMDPFGDMFKNMEEMSRNMMQKFETFDGGNGQGHSYCTSSQTTYTNDGKSKPRYYQATSSTRTAPGEIKETRRTVRDSEREVEKMAIGQHMGKKGKIMERRRTRGQQEEETNYLHMDEDEGPAFAKEWQRRATGLMDIPSQRRPQPLASGSTGSSRSSFFDGGGFNSSPPPGGPRPVDRRQAYQRKNKKVQLRE